MYLPKLNLPKVKRALLILTQPEIIAFKSLLSLKAITTFLGVKIYLEAETIICGPIFSAPPLGFLFEILRKLPLKRVLFLGWVGSFSEALPLGGIFLPTKAYSQGGLTKSLFPRRQVFLPSQPLLNLLRIKLQQACIFYQEGSILSVDYPFTLESEPERVKRFRGAKAVDLETASLFALGEYHQMELAGLHFVTDRVGSNNSTLPVCLSGLRERLSPLLSDFLNGGWDET